jgi:hypothetical protein
VKRKCDAHASAVSLSLKRCADSRAFPPEDESISRGETMRRRRPLPVPVCRRPRGAWAWLRQSTQLISHHHRRRSPENATAGCSLHALQRVQRLVAPREFGACTLPCLSVAFQFMKVVPAEKMLTPGRSNLGISCAQVAGR